jgi:endoglucanase
MRKFLSLLTGATLPLIVCVILAGCKTEKASTESTKSSTQSSATAAPAQPAAKPAATTSSTAATTAPAAQGTTIRIKAGGTAPFKDSSGNTWLPDQGFDGGDTVERPDAPITGTKDPGLYQSEHYSMSSFSAKVPNGKYIAKLHFCETFDGISGKGDRVFSVNVQNGQKMIKDLDVFAKAGGANKPYVETVPVEVTNGTFKLDFISNVENPQINAIELTPAS